MDDSGTAFEKGGARSTDGNFAVDVGVNEARAGRGGLLFHLSGGGCGLAFFVVACFVFIVDSDLVHAGVDVCP